MPKKKSSVSLLITIILAIFQPNSLCAESDRNRISYRPLYHFSPKRGYMNDPNGLFYYNGVYHLFFQHYGMGSKTWGHATSTDLLHWTEHKDAIKPRNGFQAFSGSAVVDYNNTSGLQKGEHPPIVAIYTAWGDGQHTSYSTDGGWTWNHYGKVLSLPNDKLKSFPKTARDPMVIWHQPTQKWVMVIYQPHKNGYAFAFYTSSNLKDWNYESGLPEFYVCPDLFELPVEGQKGKTKWVILDWQRDKCQYSIGEFDGKTFTTEAGPIRYVYGKRNHAATQTWKQSPDGDDRLIQIVNIWRAKYPGEPFENQMSLPLELKLKQTPEGLRLCRTPIKEVETLYKDTVSLDNIRLSAGDSKSINVDTRSFAVEAEIDIRDGGNLTLEVLGRPIVINDDSVLFEGFEAKLPGTKPGKLQVFADIVSVELFVNDGEVTILYAVDPPAEPKPIRFTASGSAAITLKNTSVHKMSSTLRSAAKGTDILTADFESNTYGQWISTGKAFGNSPAKGTLPSQKTVSGYEGKGLVNTYLGKDGATGTLTSPEFKIERSYLNFLIGGGNHPSKTCMDLLLDDGQIAHTVTGKDDEKLNWTTWDITEFKGKNVSLQIIDSEKGGWGHINVDHIYQSNIPKADTIQQPWQNVPVKNYELKIKIDKDFLNFPVNDSNSKSVVSITDSSRDPYIKFDIALADDKHVFWASQNVSRFKGKTITLVFDRIMKSHKALTMIHQSDIMPDISKLYDLKYRPRFHYSPKVGWVNDPNGMFYYNGVWHFFYQYNPYSMKWSNMKWGYATSTDLVHWREHGVAFEMPYGKLAFSGGGVVDWKNTTGLQNGEHPPLLLYVTEPTDGQYLVYSDDGGKNWKLYGNKPVTTIKHRDPKVFWYAPGDHWVMTLFTGNYNGSFNFSTSKNGIDWTAPVINKFPGHNECPDMFEMSVEHDPTDKKWIFLSGSGNHNKDHCAKYIVGTFDGLNFSPIQDSIAIDSGIGNYSTQVYSNAPDNRKVFVGWYSRRFRSVGYEGMPSNAQFRVPWELSLYKDKEGVYRLRRMPVDELKSLRTYCNKWGPFILNSGELFDSELNSYELDIELEIKPGKEGSFILNLAGLNVTYDCSSNELKAFGRTVELSSENFIKFRILLDRTSVEIFVNDGVAVMSGLSPVDFDTKPFTMTSDSGTHRIYSLRVYQLDSIWE